MEHFHCISLLTYNVNFGTFYTTSEPSLQAHMALEAIMKARADVVLLQETNEGWESFFRQNLKEEYPHQVWHAPTHWLAAGSAVLVRRGWKLDVDILPTGVDGSHFDQMIATVQNLSDSQRPGPAVRLVNVHLRPPLAMGDENGIWANVKAYMGSSTIHRLELESLLARCRDLDKAEQRECPIVVAGDFNEGGHWQAGRMLRDMGLVDVLDTQRNKTTWHWPLPIGRLTGSYDHIFFDKRCTLEEGLVMTEYEEASDHVPVLARLTMHQPASPTDTPTIVGGSSHRFASSS